MVHLKKFSFKILREILTYLELELNLYTSSLLRFGNILTSKQQQYFSVNYFRLFFFLFCLSNFALDLDFELGHILIRF